MPRTPRLRSPAATPPATMSNPDSTAPATSSSSPPTAAPHTDHTPLCRSYGVPTTAPMLAPWTALSDSPPPAYRPIRMPAVNAPTNTTAIVLSPVPQPLPVPPVAPPLAFQDPAKRIASPDDIARFHASLHGLHFLGFVAALSASVHGRKFSDPLPSPAVNVLLDLISALSALVESTSPLPHNSRYGNPAFRLWHKKLTDSANELIARITAVAASPSDLVGTEVELESYLLYSFGNATSIDYGTGSMAQSSRTAPVDEADDQPPKPAGSICQS